MKQQILKDALAALRVIVFTQHIREYLERYDPQALKQAIGALSANLNLDAELANAREQATPEAAYGEYNRRVDAQRYPVRIIPAGTVIDVPHGWGEWCDECGETIPDSEPSMISTYHKQSCSLYPSNQENDPELGLGPYAPQ